MGLLDRWPKTAAKQLLDPPSPSELERFRQKHKWSGQGYCHYCGNELLIVEQSSRDDYDPFTGAALGKPVKTLYCSGLKYLYGAYGPSEWRDPGAKSMWTCYNLHYNDHDFWFAEL